MPKFKRFWIKFGRFFLNIPSAIGGFLKKIPFAIWGFLKKIGNWFSTFFEALRFGNAKTKLSLLIWGFGCFAYGQIGRGLLLLAYEVLFVLYMVFFGGQYLAKIGTLGDTPLIKNEYGVPVNDYDNSFSILLYSMLSLIVIVFTVLVMILSVKLAFNNQLNYSVAKRLATSRDDFAQLMNKKFHLTILAFPSLTLVVFTVVPLLFMIFVAFTNFSRETMPPNNLFTWVGFENFNAMLFGGQISGSQGQDIAKYTHTFWYILRWTLIWAVLATFSNLFVGMFVAILINKKGIKLKKFWRTCLVTVIAVPQFISLLLYPKCL